MCRSRRGWGGHGRPWQCPQICRTPGLWFPSPAQSCPVQPQPFPDPLPELPVGVKLLRGSPPSPARPGVPLPSGPSGPLTRSPPAVCPQELWGEPGELQRGAAQAGAAPAGEGDPRSHRGALGWLCRPPRAGAVPWLLLSRVPWSSLWMIPVIQGLLGGGSRDNSWWWPWGPQSLGGPRHPQPSTGISPEAGGQETSPGAAAVPSSPSVPQDTPVPCPSPVPLGP